MSVRRGCEPPPGEGVAVTRRGCGCHQKRVWLSPGEGVAVTRRSGHEHLPEGGGVASTRQKNVYTRAVRSVHVDIVK